MAYRYQKKRHSNKQRIRALEFQSSLNKPEMKLKTLAASGSNLPDNTISFNCLTDIVAGSSRDERVGYKIKVHRVEIHFRSTGSSVDHYMLMTPGNHTPTYTDFYAVPNSPVAPPQDVLYKQLRHRCGSGDENYTGLMVWKSKRGVVCTYNGTASNSGVLNRFWYVIKNDIGVAVSNYSYVTKVYYTDA